MECLQFSANEFVQFHLEAFMLRGQANISLRKAHCGLAALVASLQHVKYRQQTAEHCTRESTSSIGLYKSLKQATNAAGVEEDEADEDEADRESFAFLSAGRPHGARV